MTIRTVSIALTIACGVAAEVVVEYSAAAGPVSDLRIGTHLVGATVRGIGLDRAPRQP